MNNLFLRRKVEDFMAVKISKATTKTESNFITEGEVRIVPIDSVKLWADNPRINDKAVAPLMAIIKEYGQVTPITVTPDNIIRKGNTTWKAMKRLGAKKIRALFVDFGSTRKSSTYGTADNKAGEFSDWDNEKLMQLLMSTGEDEADDPLYKQYETGFTEKELNLFRNSQALPAALDDIKLSDTAKRIGSPFFIVVFKEENITELETLRKEMNLTNTQVTLQYTDLKNYILGKGSSFRGARKV